MKQLTYDESSNSIVKTEVVIQLETGQIKHHYRVANGFIIRERVLHGFRKTFLDGLDVFTIHGHFIGKVYRIRDNEYGQLSSKELVTKIIFEYLYSDLNRLHLEKISTELYDMPQDKEFNKMNILNFIISHEK